MMTGERLGIGHEPQHGTAYLQSWIQALENGSKKIRAAAVDAQRISDWLMAREVVARSVCNSSRWARLDRYNEGTVVRIHAGSGRAGHPAGGQPGSPKSRNATLRRTTPNRANRRGDSRPVQREHARTYALRWLCQVNSPRGTMPGCTFDDPAIFGIAFRLKSSATPSGCITDTA